MFIKKAFLLARRQQIRYATFLTNTLAFLALSEANLLREAKRFWAIEGPQLWFENTWHNLHFEDLDDYWRQEFRFSRKTLCDIIDIVTADMEKRDTTFRRASLRNFIRDTVAGKCRRPGHVRRQTTAFHKSVYRKVRKLNPTHSKEMFLFSLD